MLLLKKKKLYVNNYGNHSRDFTYIKDVNLILYNCNIFKEFGNLSTPIKRSNDWREWFRGTAAKTRTTLQRWKR